MSPQEKAEWLKVQFFILPDEVEAVGRLKGYEAKQLAKRCAIICVGQIIDAVGTIEDQVYEWERQPSQDFNYWKEVLECLKNQ